MHCKFAWSAGIKGYLVAIVVFATPALGGDCGQGTYPTNSARFFSDEFVGSLAIVPQARSVQEAKNAGLYCVLQSSAVQVKRRLNRVFFAFNHFTTGSLYDAEIAFIGLETRSPTQDPGLSITMSREGDNWEHRPLDDQYSRRQITYSGDVAIKVARAHQPFVVASLTPTDVSDQWALISTEQDFADKVGASVHGEVRPSVGPQTISTWSTRYRLKYVRDLSGTLDSPGESVWVVWYSFDQHRTAPQLLRGVPHVATQVIVGNADKMDVHLFGSNGQVPEQSFQIMLTH
jgi:hypothetical protein